MEKSKKVIEFENILLGQPFVNTFFLRKIGEIEVYKNGLGDNYNLSFSNAKRCIDIKLCIAKDYDDLGDVMSVIINKVDQDDMDDEPYFLLSQWLDYSNRENGWKVFCLNAYEGTFEERLKSFFVYLNELFEDEELSKVLRGETWMNFGFDWRGMK